MQHLTARHLCKHVQWRGETILFGTSDERKKIPTAGVIDVAGAVVPFRDTVKLRSHCARQRAFVRPGVDARSENADKLHGVTLDSALSMDRHVTEVVRSCSYHTRALRHIRPLLTLDVAKSIVVINVYKRFFYFSIKRRF